MKQKQQYSREDYFRKDGKRRHIKKDGTPYFQNSGKQGRKVKCYGLCNIISVQFTVDQEEHIMRECKRTGLGRCEIIRSCVQYCMDGTYPF